MVFGLLARLVPYVLRLVVAVAALLLCSYAGGLWLIRRAESGPPPTPPARIVRAGANTVHYQEQGQGPPLALLHGVPGSADDWPAELVSALARHHRVLALDLLGFGYSSRRDPLGIDRWAAQVLATFDELGIAQATLVGHDVGAAVAVATAAAAPERVPRLVLVATAVPLDRDDWPSRLRLVRTPGLGEGMAGWSVDLLRPVGTPPGVGEGAWWAIPGTRLATLAVLRSGIDAEAFRTALGRVRARTLVLHGEADDVVPWKAVQRWAPSIEAALVRPIPDVGHWPAQEVPALVASAIVRFTTGSQGG